METLKEGLYNYYREQLERITPGKAGGYACKVQLRDGEGTAKTNHLDLNNESATELVRFLKMHYKISFDESLNTFIVKILPWTNTKPKRVKIISERFKQSVIIPFHDDGPNHMDASDIAKAWLISKGFIVNGHSEGANYSYIMSETFKPLKEKK